ncbi:putative MFS family arabinose efflux permease [Sphaerotilus hippei]|uniref:Putative MFS family arabinose efflux permease n=1 Tax=Sphaerotilus hippei TaxID=744406 RepID=A0A318H4G8_9BURK|nr:MFS transporter [Sphaerotilus hippei]PXW98051.1 putative MFS family arabinose efflux permease [Sphaerotilus hippei]
MSAGTAAAASPLACRAALLSGNFAIGCGVMVVAGSLNDLVRSLGIPVALGGQLISAGAATMCFGAPLLAALLGRFDRRRLLTWTLLAYALGHLLCAFAPDFATLLPLRALATLGAAVFTPQAAATIGHMAEPGQRGKAITTVFLGWSLAAVLGMPMHSYIGETLGWRWAFGLVTLLSVVAATWVWRVIPDGVKPPQVSRAQWRGALTHPVLMATVAVTALAGAGQFTVFSYLAPYYRQVLGASAVEVSLLFMWFGAFGLLGNVLLSRHVDRFGAARLVGWSLAGMAVSLLLWPLGRQVATLALVLLPWALAGFASNSGQQARLGLSAPALAPALMAMNTSAIYLGQAVGAVSGGLLLGSPAEPDPFARLHWAGLGWMLLALAISTWAARRQRSGPV